MNFRDTLFYIDMKNFLFLFFLTLMACQSINNYPIYMTTDQTFGLDIGSRIECSEIDIGEVKKIVPNEDGKYRMTLAIKGDFFIPNRSKFVIRPTKDMKMLVDVQSVESIDFLKRGNEVNGEISRNYEEWVSAIKGMDTNGNNHAKLDSVAAILNNAVNEINDLMSTEKAE